jgi:hypothetical protein
MSGEGLAWRREHEGVRLDDDREVSSVEYASSSGEEDMDL